MSGEDLPLKQKHRIEVGNVYRIPLGRKDGLTVAQEDELRSKYFIVIGIDSKGTIYGGLLISSKPPKNVPLTISMYQYPVKAEKNCFLNWDSWINCTHIYQAPQNKLNISNYLGRLDKESLYYIISAINENSYTGCSGRYSLCTRGDQLSSPPSPICL